MIVVWFYKDFIRIEQQLKQFILLFTMKLLSFFYDFIWVTMILFLCYTHCNYVVAKLFHFLLSQHAMIRNRIRVMLHLAYPRNNWQQWCSYVIFSQKEDSSATGASCPDSNATCVNFFVLGVNPLECPAEACVGKKHLWKGMANILYRIKLIPIAVRAPPAHWSY